MKISKIKFQSYKYKLKNCKIKAVLKAIKFLNYKWILLILQF